MEGDAERRLDKALKVVLNRLAQDVESIKKEAKQKLDQYFAQGRKLEREEHKAREKDRATRGGLIAILRMFDAIRPRVGEESDFQPDDGLITLHDRDEAKDLVDKIDRSVRVVVEMFNEVMRGVVVDVMKTYEANMADIRRELEEALRTLDSRMKGQGFELELRILGVRSPKLPAVAQDVFEQMLDEQEYRETRRRHKDTIWGSICSLFGTSQWGTEEYVEKQKRYVIDIPQAREAVSAGIDGCFRLLPGRLKSQVEDPLRIATNELFRVARTHVERIRGDLIRSREDAELDAEAKRELVDRLGAFASRGRDISKDVEGLQGDVAGLA